MKARVFKKKAKKRRSHELGRKLLGVPSPEKSQQEISLKDRLTQPVKKFLSAETQKILTGEHRLTQLASRIPGIEKIVEKTGFVSGLQLQGFNFFEHVTALTKAEVGRNIDELFWNISEVLCREVNVEDFVVSAFVANKNLLNNFFQKMGREEFRSVI